jgi:hypothetical protein
MPGQYRFCGFLSHRHCVAKKQYDRATGGEGATVVPDVRSLEFLL